MAMNNFMKRYIMEKRGGRDYNRGYDGNYDYGRSEFEGEFRGDYESDYAPSGGRYGGGKGRRDYAGEEYETDGRRGVKYTGPYGIGGRRHYPRRDRAMYDGNDYGEEEQMHLTKREITEWKEGMSNTDGTHGPHFDIGQIEQATQALNLQMRGYDLKDLCMIANMLYSHLGEMNKQFLPREKEAIYYTKAAKIWLEDKDAKLHGSEKALVYFYDFVCDDEE